MNRVFQRSLLLAWFSIALIAVSACVPIAAPTPVPAAPSNTITNIVWQWTSATNKPTRETSEVPDPQSYTITFRDDGTLNGVADCNNFTGTYTQEGGFFITLGAMTMAACGEDSLEQQYLQLLVEIVAGGPDGAGGFALETAGGEKRMVFVNGGSAPAP